MLSTESVLLIIAGGAILVWGACKYVIYLGLMPSHPSGVLAPWGSVVSARKVVEPKSTDTGILFGRALLATGVCMVALPIVGLVLGSAFGLLSPESISQGGDYHLLGLLVAAFVCRQERGFLRGIVFGAIGGFVFGLFAGALIFFVLVQLVDPATLSGNLVLLFGTTIFYALGTTYGITFAPITVRFERTFADGHTDQVVVSSRTSAYDRLSALCAS